MMDNNTLQSDLVLAVNETALNALAGADMRITKNCLLSITSYINITQAYFYTHVRNITMATTSGDIEEDIDTAINNILYMFISSSDSAIPAFFNAIIVAPLLSLLDSTIAKKLIAPHTCSPLPPTPAPSWDTQANLGMTLGLSGAGLLCIILTTWVLIKRKNTFRADKVPLLSTINNKLQSETVQFPLILSPHLNAYARIIIPSLCILSIGLFINSNTGVGASVIFEGTVGDKTSEQMILFTFSLGNSVKDMWQAGIYPLSIMVALFSGGVRINRSITYW